MPRGSRSRASAERRSSASSIVAPGRLSHAEARSPAAASSSAWVVSPTGSRPARAAAARTAARSTVAVRSWRPTWRSGSPPTAWRAKARRVPAGPRRRVQGRGLVGVVHEHHRPAGEMGGRARQPAVDREADLGDLAVRERDALGLEARREVGRARLGLEPGEAVAVDADEELAEAVGPADDAVDRQRVEDLVRDDGARLRRGPGGGSSVARWPARPSAARRASRAAMRAASRSTGR